MKTVLCYGDSNTYGYGVEGVLGERYAREVRWPGVLQQALGTSWHVIEEGLNGRTTVSDDPVEGLWKNGRTPLMAILHSHKPLDWVVIKLGTNDLKTRFHKDAREIALGVGVLVGDIQRTEVGPGGGVPQILMVAPAPILDNCQQPHPAFAGQAGVSAGLAREYAAVAAQMGVHFLTAGDIISSSPVDGIHLSADAHGRLGRAVSELLLQTNG